MESREVDKLIAENKKMKWYLGKILHEGSFKGTQSYYGSEPDKKFYTKSGSLAKKST